MFWATIAYAQSAGGKSIPLLDNLVKNVLNPVVGLMLSVAVIVFLYGIVEFLGSGENISKNEEGKRHMVWGIVGIFIMVAVNGIMRVICGTIGASC